MNIRVVIPATSVKMVRTVAEKPKSFPSLRVRVMMVNNNLKMRHTRSLHKRVMLVNTSKVLQGLLRDSSSQEDLDRFNAYMQEQELTKQQVQRQPDELMDSLDNFFASLKSQPTTDS